MSIVQQVQDGVVLSDKTQSSSSSSTSTSTDSTKEMFLQLLVTEMQYQDPLEPTDNSEYVKELATFTQVETLQAVQDSVSSLQGSEYVGKYVEITTDDGEEVSGCVDYVTEDSGTIYVSVDGTKYDIENVTSVVDDTYYEANYLANSFATIVAALPSASALTTSDAEKVATARSVYDSLDSYQKSFVSSSALSTLEALEAKLATLS